MSPTGVATPSGQGVAATCHGVARFGGPCRCGRAGTRVARVGQGPLARDVGRVPALLVAQSSGPGCPADLAAPGQVVLGRRVVVSVRRCPGSFTAARSPAAARAGRVRRRSDGLRAHAPVGRHRDQRATTGRRRRRPHRPRGHGDSLRCCSTGRTSHTSGPLSSGPEIPGRRRGPGPNVHDGGAPLGTPAVVAVVRLTLGPSALRICSSAMPRSITAAVPSSKVMRSAITEMPFFIFVTRFSSRRATPGISSTPVGGKAISSPSKTMEPIVVPFESRTSFLPIRVTLACALTALISSSTVAEARHGRPGRGSIRRPWCWSECWTGCCRDPGPRLGRPGRRGRRRGT